MENVEFLHDWPEFVDDVENQDNMQNNGQGGAERQPVQGIPLRQQQPQNAQSRASVKPVDLAEFGQRDDETDDDFYARSCTDYLQQLKVEGGNDKWSKGQTNQTKTR